MLCLLIIDLTHKIRVNIALLDTFETDRQRKAFQHSGDQNLTDSAHEYRSTEIDTVAQQ